MDDKNKTGDVSLGRANQILAAYQLHPIATIQKSEVGFTNTIYELDNAYILKVCTDAENAAPFQREAQLYNYFASKLPVPQLIGYDDSKTLLPYSYILYPRIAGDNLYNVWHTLTAEQRRGVVKQFCELLKVISNTSLNDLPTETKLESVASWRAVIESRISRSLQIAEQMQTLGSEVVSNIKQFIQQHGSSLDEQQLALVYWDVHFDNVLVQDDKITGLLDFERTEIASIDFILDTAKRMVDFPKKYMSAYAEQFARDEDYKDLLHWYKEFYPELFAFSNIDRRLELYAIAHDLKDLEHWPDVQQLKDNILKIVGGES